MRQFKSPYRNGFGPAPHVQPAAARLYMAPPGTDRESGRTRGVFHINAYWPQLEPALPRNVEYRSIHDDLLDPWQAAKGARLHVATSGKDNHQKLAQ